MEANAPAIHPEDSDENFGGDERDDVDDVVVVTVTVCVETGVVVAVTDTVEASVCVCVDVAVVVAHTLHEAGHTSETAMGAPSSSRYASHPTLGTHVE